MPTASHHRSVLLNRLRDELVSRLHAGADIDAESLLSLHPTLQEDAEAAVELIVTEYICRRDMGQAPDARMWLLMHGRWRTPLRLRLEEIGALPHDNTASADTITAATVVARKVERSELPPLPPLPTLRKREQLGVGGMGVVYRAEEEALDREVALKLLLGGASATPDDRKRFHREARAVACLDHSNIVPIYSLGMFEGSDAFTMKLYKGGTLATTLRKSRLPARQAAAMLALVARAMHHAHGAGIVHRDLKPSNILLDEAGAPHVADFGLARQMGAETLTRPDAAMGTFAYMSPEQTRGEEAGPASDVWALGVMLHECLAGRRPFAGSGPDVMERVRNDPAPPLRSIVPTASAGLEAVILRCLAKRPQDRFVTAGELADALERWLAGEPVGVTAPVQPHRHAAEWSLGLLIVPLLMGAMLLGPSVEPEPDEKTFLRRVESRLAQGEAVVLLGNSGRPRWYQWGLEKDRMPLPDQPGPLWVDAWQPTQLRLLPRMPVVGYRIAADVAVVGGQAPGVCGLFVLGSETKVNNWSESECFVLGVAVGPGEEVTPWVGVFHFRPRVPGLGPHKMAESRRTVNPAALHAAAGMAALGAGFPTPHLLAAGLATARFLRSRATFHRLEVEIFPSSIRASFDGVVIDELKDPERAAFLRSWWQVCGLTRRPPAPRPPPDFQPNGQAGLLLTTGSAMFRNVRLTPIR